MSEQQRPVWTEMDAVKFRTKGEQVGLFADPRGDGMGTGALFDVGVGGLFEDDDQDQGEGGEGL
ncbi:hypothetical protein ACIRPQ_29395 [Streptomyces sp. NPDC101213]|uniref:hypothetical protein n=1 Tax=Streptomyces sp. NPDC101213 TaxID=3366130 RepID=UPI0038084D30